MNDKLNDNCSSVYDGNDEKTMTGKYLKQKLEDIPEKRKNVFVMLENIVVNCCVGSTKVSMDDFAKDICNLELRI